MRRIGIVLSIVVVAGLLVWLNETDRGRRLGRRNALESERIGEHRETRETLDVREVEPEVVGVAPDTVPDVYRGPVRLRGMVVEKDGAPVEGAVVHVHMPNVLPYSDAQRAYLRTKTYRDGSFEFSSLPRSQHYQLAVCRPFRRVFAQVNAPGTELVHRIVLGPPLRHSRWALYDPEGRPVPVSTAALLPTRSNRAFAARQWKGPPWDSLAGLLPSPPASNEIVRVFGEPDVTKPLATISLHPSRFWIPGFLPVELRTHGFDAADWPKSVRVELTRGDPDDDKLPYTVRFPERTAPREWRPFRNEPWFPQLTLEVAKRLGYGFGIATTTRKHNRFRANEGFVLVAPASRWSEALRYRVQRRGAEQVVIPEWPKYAWLTVRFRPAVDHSRDRLIALRTDREKYSGSAVSPYPGLALIGPLPAGEWLLVRVVTPKDGGKPASSSLNLGRLEAGHRFVDWKD